MPMERLTRNVELNGTGDQSGLGNVVAPNFVTIAGADLHANFVKLVAYLVIIKAIKITPDFWKILVKIKCHQSNLARHLKSQKVHRLYIRQSSLDIFQDIMFQSTCYDYLFRALLQKISRDDESIKFVNIGDDLSDRDGCDWMMLGLQDRLEALGVNMVSVLSNHSIMYMSERVESRLLGINGQDGQSASSLCDPFANNPSIGGNKEYYKKMVSRVKKSSIFVSDIYQPHEINIYSHAPFTWTSLFFMCFSLDLFDISEDAGAGIDLFLCKWKSLSLAGEEKYNAAIGAHNLIQIVNKAFSAKFDEVFVKYKSTMDSSKKCFLSNAVWFRRFEDRDFSSLGSPHYVGSDRYDKTIMDSVRQWDKEFTYNSAHGHTADTRAKFMQNEYGGVVCANDYGNNLGDGGKGSDSGPLVFSISSSTGETHDNRLSSVMSVLCKQKINLELMLEVASQSYEEGEENQQPEVEDKSQQLPVKNHADIIMFVESYLKDLKRFKGFIDKLKDPGSFQGFIDKLKYLGSIQGFIDKRSRYYSPDDLPQFIEWSQSVINDRKKLSPSSASLSLSVPTSPSVSPFSFLSIFSAESFKELELTTDAKAKVDAVMEKVKDKRLFNEIIQFYANQLVANQLVANQQESIAKFQNILAFYLYLDALGNDRAKVLSDVLIQAGLCVSTTDLGLLPVNSIFVQGNEKNIVSVDKYVFSEITKLCYASRDTPTVRDEMLQYIEVILQFHKYSSSSERGLVEKALFECIAVFIYDRYRAFSKGYIYNNGSIDTYNDISNAMALIHDSATGCESMGSETVEDLVRHIFRERSCFTSVLFNVPRGSSYSEIEASIPPSSGKQLRHILSDGVSSPSSSPSLSPSSSPVSVPAA